MSKLSAEDFPWKRSRFGFAVFFHFTLLAASSLLRLVLYLKFGPEGKFSVADFLQVMLIGFHRDWLFALVVTLPLLFWFWLVSDRTYSKPWHRVLLIGASFLFWGGQFFLYFTEYFFFEEFKSRFNTVAVDYLIYPSEVFGNIRDSYPLKTVIAICVLAAIVWVVGSLIYFRQMWFQPTTRRSRFMHMFVGVLLTVLIFFTVNTNVTHFERDRTLNELANNGAISFLAAAYTRNLDYTAFYKTMPLNEAYARARKFLKAPHMEYVGSTNSIRRKVSGDPERPRLNVVILLEESLGSEFWGCLGRKDTLTPEMDKLAVEEGLLFTNVYACGNRTVRGFEGVYSSFPPLPGDSIVKRDRSENVETLARVLKRDGYNTLFLYGGRGLFDGMRSYAVRNGWDRFIEEKDFANPQFTTIWGVCDEEVFSRAIEEFRALAQQDKPFFGTVLSVSNHKPFTYPAGRIPEDPNDRKRNNAVKYSDWSLGHFFALAKKETFWTNTIFVVVADHGARVYGKQDIPIHSYEIPVVILGPAAVKQPERIGTLGSSLDVPVTILGMLGRPYETMFFGRDLFKEPPETTRAVLNHNRDIGLFMQDRMVVLGLQKTVEFYEGDPKATEMTRVFNPKPEFIELEKDAVALYQVADDLYMHRHYNIDGAPLPAALPAGAVSITSTNPPPP